MIASDPLLGEVTELGAGAVAVIITYLVLQAYRAPRTTVSSQRFSGHGGTSMKRFLRGYEDFFYSKYEGNDK